MKLYAAGKRAGSEVAPTPADEILSFPGFKKRRKRKKGEEAAEETTVVPVCECPKKEKKGPRSRNRPWPLSSPSLVPPEGAQPPRSFSTSFRGALSRTSRARARRRWIRIVLHGGCRAFFPPASKRRSRGERLRREKKNREKKKEEAKR